MFILVFSFCISFFCFVILLTQHFYNCLSQDTKDSFVGNRARCLGDTMRGYNRLVLGESEQQRSEFSLRSIAVVAGIMFILVLLVVL